MSRITSSESASLNRIMPVAELRARCLRLISSKDEYRISRMGLWKLCHLQSGAFYRFLKGAPLEGVGPLRYRRLVKLVTRIDTGEWEYRPRHARIGEWGKIMTPIINHGAPRRPLPPVGALILSPAGVRVASIPATTEDRMPGFAEVMGFRR